MRFHLVALSAALTFAIAGAATAQTTATPAAPDPAVGGQASTKTPSGRCQSDPTP